MVALHAAMKSGLKDPRGARKSAAQQVSLHAAMKSGLKDRCDLRNDYLIVVVALHAAMKSGLKV